MAGVRKWRLAFDKMSTVGLQSSRDQPGIVDRRAAKQPGKNQNEDVHSTKILGAFSIFGNAIVRYTPKSAPDAE